LGIGDWAQSPIPNPPTTKIIVTIVFRTLYKYYIKKFYNNKNIIEKQLINIFI